MKMQFFSHYFKYFLTKHLIFSLNKSFIFSKKKNLKTYLSSDPRGKIDFQKKIFQENIQPCIIIYIFVLDFCWSAMENYS